MLRKKSIVIGIAGLVASGKSTVAAFIRDSGVLVFDADEVVHGLYESEKVLLKIRAALPDEFIDQEISRKKLSDLAFHNDNLLKILENILHPLVREKLDMFLQDNKNAKAVLLDIPLLFESDLYDLCDYTILTKCDPETQKERFLERNNGSLEKFEKIINNQGEISYKEQRSHFVIDTSGQLEDTKKQTEKIIKKCVK